VFIEFVNAVLRIIEDTYVESLGYHSDRWQAKKNLSKKKKLPDEFVNTGRSDALNRKKRHSREIIEFEWILF
jgi:hypothetical protein